ncbi:MAG: Uma2 family endonuclease [Cyanobacteriota bacterium]|nr:Uma2 family endonuclease [Cyanobacteriota bacterium]
MTRSTWTPLAESIDLNGIRWQTYEALVRDLGRSRRLRLTYHLGKLEIMVPSPEHELYKETLGRLVETLAEELDVRIYPLGSTTFKRPGRSGAEPDKCFYIHNLEAIRGKKRLDFDRDPPPDLVLEIDITSPSRERLVIYAELGVPEVWRFDGERLFIYQRQDDRYIERDRSLFFGNIRGSEISGFLERIADTDYLELIREFRTWVRMQLN